MKLYIEIKTEEQRNDLLKQLQQMEFKKELPKSWEELQDLKGFYIDDESVIKEIDARWNCTCDSENENIFDTEKQAKSALAKAKLSQLMRVYNDGWVVDWNNDEQEKHCIGRSCNMLHELCMTSLYQFLAFKNHETRDLFMERFEKDIKTYFELD